MRPISSHSRQAAVFSPRRPALCSPRPRRPALCSPRPRRPAQGAAAAGLSAAALVVVAACGSASSGPANSSGPASNPLSPRQALVAAATSTGRVNSATETLNVKVGGVQSQATTGTIQVRLKPTVELGANLSINAAGKNTRVKEVLSRSAIYFSAPVLTGATGKTWVKIPLSALKGAAGASFGQLFHSLQSNSFTNQTELLTVAKNAHIVGKQTVAGVSTTEYAGSFKASEGLKALPPSYRKVLSTELQALGTSTISFHAWIDGQKHVRKIIETESVNGETVTTTVIITGINQPVHITVPRASQVGTMPGL